MRTTDIGLLILRLVMGGGMLFGHGLGKLSKLMAGGEIQFADPIGVGEVPSLVLAVLAEVLCSALIMLGLFTRWALIPAFITMAVALFIVHGGDAFEVQEKSLLYGTGYLVLLLTGPGKIAMDHYLKKR